MTFLSYGTPHRFWLSVLHDNFVIYLRWTSGLKWRRKRLHCWHFIEICRNIRLRRSIRNPQCRRTRSVQKLLTLVAQNVRFRSTRDLAMSKYSLSFINFMRIRLLIIITLSARSGPPAWVWAHFQLQGGGLVSLFCFVIRQPISQALWCLDNLYLHCHLKMSAIWKYSYLYKLGLAVGLHIGLSMKPN